MTYKIGFVAENDKNECTEPVHTVPGQVAEPKKSLVQVRFEEKNMTLAYYNDRFDLHCGDLVYVEGKLEGLRGRVTAVNYNFKIKIADYKRVIAVVDTCVSGRFHMAGSHFVTFDRCALPGAKVLSWFKAPAAEEEYVCGSDDETFLLDHLGDMPIGEAIAERGHEYYLENKVRYLSIDGTRGFAIVEGREAYEVEFDYHQGAISNLTCSCYCSYNCKHEFAAMLQLKETLKLIEKHYADEYDRNGYFAAIYMPTLFVYAIDGKEKGSFVL